MTIGDVLAVTSGLTLIGAAWVAAILLFGLAFPARTAAAQARLTASPGVCLAWGAGTGAAALLLAAVLWNAPAAPVRLLAGVVAAGAGFALLVGSAGTVRLLGARIDALGSPMTPFASLTRAAILYVLAGFLPVIGWFLVLPGALLLALGSGGMALMPARARCPAALPDAGAIQAEAIQ